MKKTKQRHGSTVIPVGFFFFFSGLFLDSAVCGVKKKKKKKKNNENESRAKTLKKVSLLSQNHNFRHQMIQSHEESLTKRIHMQLKDLIFHQNHHPVDVIVIALSLLVHILV